MRCGALAPRDDGCGSVPRNDRALARALCHRAAKLLGVALEGSAKDGPSMELLRRVVTGMNQGCEGFDPVWRFADK